MGQNWNWDFICSEDSKQMNNWSNLFQVGGIQIAGGDGMGIFGRLLTPP